MIGAGAAGLSVAVGAAQMGASVVLIEKDKMGGDCLNSGCVPSKSLLASAHMATKLKNGKSFGIQGGTPGDVDFSAVQSRVQGIIDTIAPHDSQTRMESLGIKVIRAAACFENEKEVHAGDHKIRAKRFVIAVGSRPRTPNIEGIEEVPYFTNETIFSNKEHLPHLIVLGGGPIGVEMAQAHAELGCKITLIQSSHLLPRDDLEAVDVVRESLIESGIKIHEYARVEKVEKIRRRVKVSIVSDQKEEEITGSHLLVAVGRQPNLEGLHLSSAGVKVTEGRGIEVNDRLQTSNKRIYALGDTAGGPQFTHWASYQSSIVLRNLIFGLRAKASATALPWVTYASPELAQVGLTESQAKRKYRKIKVLKKEFRGNDRSVAQGQTKGFMKVILTPRGKVLGATIVGENAGELLFPWILAVQGKITLSDLAGSIVPYPTVSEVTKQLAGQFYAPKIFSPLMKKIVRFFMSWK